MVAIDKKLEKFFHTETEDGKLLVIPTSSSKYEIFPPNIGSAAEYVTIVNSRAVSLTYSGSLEDASGTSRDIVFKAYPQPPVLEPNLVVEVLGSDDNNTFTSIQTLPYDNLPVIITTSYKYIIALVKTTDTPAKILFSTRDAEKGYIPTDPRVAYVEAYTYQFPDDTYIASFPLFWDTNMNSMVVDTSYRGIESFSDSNIILNVSGDTIRVLLSNGQYYVRVGDSYSPSHALPKEFAFPPGSVQAVLGQGITKQVSLYALTDTLILLATLRSVFPILQLRYDALITELNNLARDNTTNMYYETYYVNGTPKGNSVDIAANVYLASRLLSSANDALHDIVLTPVGGVSLLEAIGNVVNTADGVVVPDYYDGSNFTNHYRAYTEGLFYLLEQLVEKEFASVQPSSFDSQTTLQTILSLVDVSTSTVYGSIAEKNGSSSAPPKRSLDVYSLLAALKSVPVTATEDYTQEVALVQADLQGFVLINNTGVQINNDPANVNYNPYWTAAPPITGLQRTVDGIVDLDVTYEALNFVPTLGSEFEVTTTSTDDGVLLVDKGDGATERYIVPSLRATSLEALKSVTTPFIKTSVYTTTVLNNTPNNVTISQTPTAHGVLLDISLSYAAGIVAIASGVTSGTPYDVVSINTASTNHSVYLNIPYVTESVQITVIPTMVN